MKVKPQAEILAVCEQVATEVGVKVCSVEIKQGNPPTLTIIIDKVGGMDLDSCEKFSRAVDVLFDELDPTYGEPYTLNVSSRGIDWAFVTDEDFTSHIGTKVEVKLKNSIRGKKYYDGELLSYDGKSVSLKVDEKQTFTIDLNNIAKMNEYIDFE